MEESKRKSKKDATPKVKKKQRSNNNSEILDDESDQEYIPPFKIMKIESKSSPKKLSPGTTYRKNKSKAKQAQKQITINKQSNKTTETIVNSQDTLTSSDNDEEMYFEEQLHLEEEIQVIIIPSEENNDSIDDDEEEEEAVSPNLLSNQKGKDCINDDDDDDEEEDEEIVQNYAWEGIGPKETNDNNQITKDIKLIQEFTFGIDTSQLQLTPDKNRHNLNSIWSIMYTECQKLKDFNTSSLSQQKESAWKIFRANFSNHNPGLFYCSSWRHYATTYKLRRLLTPSQLREIIASSSPGSHYSLFNHNSSSPTSSNRQLTPREIGTLAEEPMRIATEKKLNCLIIKPSSSFTSQDKMFVCKIDGLLKINGQLALWENKFIGPYKNYSSIEEAIYNMTEIKRKSAFILMKNGQLYMNKNHLYGHQVLLMMTIHNLNKAYLTIGLKDFDYLDSSTHHHIQVVEVNVDPEALRLWYSTQLLIAHSIIKNSILPELFLGNINSIGKLNINGGMRFCEHCSLDVPPGEWNNHIILFHLFCDRCSNIFPNINKLNIHLFKVHEEKPKFFCSLCSVSFVILYGLKRHNIIVHSDHEWKCLHCQLKFKKRKLLFKHIHVDHKNLSPDTYEKNSYCNNPACFFYLKLMRKDNLKDHVYSKGEKYNECRRLYEAEENMKVITRVTKKSYRKPKSKIVFCTNPDCDSFEKLKTKGDLKDHVHSKGKKFEECRRLWELLNPGKVIENKMRGSRRQGKRDEPNSVGVCIKDCRKKILAKGDSEKNQNLRPKRSLLQHINGQMSKTPPQLPCPHFWEWQKKNKNTGWNSAAWRCSCLNNFSVYFNLKIEIHKDSCIEYQKYKNRVVGAIKPEYLPKFFLPPLQPKDNKKSKTVKKNDKK